MQELRFLNYGINGTLLGLSTLLAASQLIHPGSAAASPNIIGALKDLAQQGSQFYEYFVDVHPIATKVCLIVCLSRFTRSILHQVLPCCSKICNVDHHTVASIY